MALQTLSFFDLRSGMNDRGDAIEIPLTYMQEIKNMYVDRDSLRTKGGFVKRYTTALQGGKPIQAIHQYEDENLTRYLIYAVNGHLYRDNMDGEAPTDITGTLTLSTSQDARFHFVNWDGKCYGTEGVNPQFYIASGTANAAAISTLGRGIPTRASALEVFKNSFFWGNFTDFDTNATNRKYGVIYSVPAHVEQYEADQGARNELDRRGEIVALNEHDSEALIIYRNRGIWYAEFSPASDLGQAQTNFVYKQLDNRVGLKAGKGVHVTPQGTMWVDDRGIYWIPSGYPPAKPKYISKPIEKFWSTINPARLPYICCAEMPEKNGVLFCVPHGVSQSNNNRGIFLNYESWTQWGQDIDDVHPAFSVFEGGAQAYAFNCLATIIDTDGRDRLVGGDYSGYVYTLDAGALDDGDDFRASFRTPLIGTPGRENAWNDVILDCDLDNRKLLNIVQRNYDNPTPVSKIIRSGTTGAVLDEFMLDVDTLAGDSLGPIRAELYGESRYTELEITVLSGVPFAAHGITIHFEPGDSI